MGNRFLAHVLLASGLVAQTAPTSRPASVETTATLEGRVIDLRGEAVPLAEVWIADSRESLQPLARGKCDGNGFFRIAGVPRRARWTVHALGEGRCEVEVPISGTVERVPLVVHDAVAVRGHLLTRAGKGVAGAYVRVDSEARVPAGLCCEAETDREGSFVLPRVPLGPMRFCAVVPGEGLAELRTRITKETEVKLEPGDELTTSITIALEGVPAAALPDVTVEVLPYVQGHPARLPRPWAEPKLASQGTLQLELVPDRSYAVSMRCVGFAISPERRNLEHGEGPHVARFKATPLGSRSLQCPARVVGADGKPLAGVRLRMRGFSGVESSEVTSDGDGKLVFDSPVAAGALAYIESRSAEFVVDPGKDDSPQRRLTLATSTMQLWRVEPNARLELRVVPACSVSGRVLRSDGGAAAMVQVELEGQQSSWPGHWEQVAWSQTDRDGRFRFSTLSDRAEALRVRVFGPGGVVAEPNLAMKHQGQHLDAGDLVVAAPGAVEGVVRSRNGAPAPGIWVELNDWNLERDVFGGRMTLAAVTDRSGRFRFASTPPGCFVLRVMESDALANPPLLEPFQVEAGKPRVREVILPE